MICSLMMFMTRLSERSPTRIGQSFFQMSTRSGVYTMQNHAIHRTTKHMKNPSSVCTDCTPMNDDAGSASKFSRLKNTSRSWPRRRRNVFVLYAFMMRIHMIVTKMNVNVSDTDADAMTHFLRYSTSEPSTSFTK
eukprot:Amastigsp_a349328_15.p3 type:complete len:135 gc:universal Amastigsp_a349328_15:430-26(-)